MNKLPVKIMFVDIDWTIFDHTIEKFDLVSIEVLKKAQEAGILVYMSTARPWHSVMQLGLFDIFTPDGIITSNGSAIFSNDELIYGVEIPKDIVQNVCKEAKKHHMNVEITTPKSRYVISRRMEGIKKLYSTFFDVLPEYHKYDNSMTLTMLVVGPSKYDEYIKQYLRKDMYCFRFSDDGMDISCSPTEKGHAINLVLKHHNLSKDDAVSFGDSYLDLSMFNSTRYSVAVGNAEEKAKQSAMYVTDTVMDHGVGNFIKENII